MLGDADVIIIRWLDVSAGICGISRNSCQGGSGECCYPRASWNSPRGRLRRCLTLSPLISPPWPMLREPRFLIPRLSIEDLEPETQYRGALRPSIDSALKHRCFNVKGLWDVFPAPYIPLTITATNSPLIYAHLLIPLILCRSNRY